MKVSTEIDNNFGYEKITQLVDNIPLRTRNLFASLLIFKPYCIWISDQKPISRFPSLLHFCQSDYLYWYVVALEVWRKPHYESHVSDPMYHPMKMAIARLWKCCYTALHATSNPIGHYRIFRIIIYSWHKVTLMWPVMGFPKIYNAATSVKVSGWEIWF